MSYLDAMGPGYEDMQRRVPDCNLALELIGFTPTRTLDDIIHSVIADQTDNLSAAYAAP
jgi:UDP-glucose 4-epimerase